jgi:hypothetical protein
MPACSGPATSSQGREELRCENLEGPAVFRPLDAYFEAVTEAVRRPPSAAWATEIEAVPASESECIQCMPCLR